MVLEDQLTVYQIVLWNQAEQKQKNNVQILVFKKTCFFS